MGKIFSKLAVLRIALGITFLWIGVLQFLNPSGWVSFLPNWLVSISPLSDITLVKGLALLDALLGALLVIGLYIRVTSIICSLQLIAILIFNGVGDITARDIGLLGASVYLFLASGEGSI